MGDPILFLILAAIAIAASLGMITSRNAIYSALYLILTMVVLAVFFLLLNAPFLAMVQIVVYAGAIMVLFLFVIMLLGAEKLGGDEPAPSKWLARILGVILVGLFAFVVLENQTLLNAASMEPIDASPQAVGLAFFQTYTFPFEVTSVLLLVAMIGVVVLQVRRRRD